MSTCARPPIPYKRQDAGWTCGAAALEMAYRSMGLEVAQAEVWAGLVPGPDPQVGVTTPRLAWEARSRGLEALAFRTRNAWGTLVACGRTRVRVILNLPIAPGSSRRHFSVLAGLDPRRGAWLHDPALGPSLWVDRRALLVSWNARNGNPSAVTDSLAALAPSRPGAHACASCRTTVPEAAPCPGCGEAIGLRPAEALGCVAPVCPERLWERIYCPTCERPLTPSEIPTMDASDPFGKLDEAVNFYRQKLENAQGATDDTSVRSILEGLHTQMKQSASQFGEAMQQLDRHQQEQAKYLETLTADTNRRMEEAKAIRDGALAARKAADEAAAAPPPPAPQEKPLDPLLGAKLRDLLLQEFGVRKVAGPTGPSTAGGSILDYDPSRP